MIEFENYKILYSLGMHHITIDVDSNDFNKLIDDLSNEFTVHKKEYLDRFNNPEETGFNVLEVDYYIINYHDDLEYIGSCSKRV